MLLDYQTLRNLELFETLRDRSRRGSLIAVLDRTVTAMGARRLKQWLLRPLCDIERIRRRQDAVSELCSSPSLIEDLREQLKGFHDLERLLSRLGCGTCTARELAALRDSLERIPKLRFLLEYCESDPLRKIWSELDELPELLGLLERALVDSPPATVTEGGMFKEGYDPRLDELLRTVREGREWIANLQQREIKRSGIASLKVGYNKVFGYYIEVSKPNLKYVPDDYQRKQTIANGERFITPELKTKEAEILAAEERLGELEYELFQELREETLRHTARIQHNAELIAELDVYLSLAKTALEKRYARPEVSESAHIHIVEGRHPVVEELMQCGRFVPNDTVLNPGSEQILVITGPNMAGKSTYLRQVALIVLMAHIGSFVPAKKAEIGLVDRIFTRVGAQDNLVGGQSTFMVEMNETAAIVNAATERSLIVMDEIGRGTSTFDGVSIAWAVAEFIHDHIGARTLFATHYHELTELADLLPRAKNYNVAVREWGDRIVFLYKIVPGATEHSYGIEVAKLAGLPQRIIDRARKVLHELEAQAARTEVQLVETGGAGGGTGQGAAQQLTLFTLEPSPIEQELKELDLDSINPRQALEKLYEWQRQLKDRGK